MTKTSSSSVKYHSVRAMFVIGALFFLGVGCGVVSVEQSNVQKTILEKLRGQSQIKKFVNTEELRAFLEEHLQESGYGYERAKLGFGDAAIMRSQETQAPVDASPDYSRTNVQVEGVDEGDIAKTDGEYIYTISGNTVVIMKAYPVENAKVAARIQLDDSPQGLYIAGDRLIVYGYDSRVYAAERKLNPSIEIFPPIRPGASYTFVRIFDIRDRANPRETRDLSFEGSYMNSRMIGEHLYFVTISSTYDIMEEELPFPHIFENGEQMVFQAEQMPNVYYFDFPYQSPNFTTVSALNVADNDAPPTREVYLLDASQTMYVSPENLYLTYTKYLNEYEVRMALAREIIAPRLSEKDKERIQKIESVDPAALSREERRQKINVIIGRYIARLPETERNALNNDITRTARETYQNIASELERTVIHKISLKGSALAYQTFGEVPGSVLNQFSMDEREGYFRIATTKNRSWFIFLEEDDSERGSYSNLYVLDADLKTVGSLQGLAPGERIYSARFMQGRAYLVTFQQTDPLFVIDVSEPTAPRVLGELKIPGFSQYLHPYDNATLIGFGRDTEARPDGGAIQKGLKLSLFDVSDVTAPREIDTYIFDNPSSYSPALEDHHAFLFSRDKNMLVIPFTDYQALARQELSRSIGKPIIDEPSLGAAVFSVTRDGLSFKGKVTHGYDYNAAIVRSMYIDDNLFALSNRYVTIHALVDIRELKRVLLEE